MIKCLRGPQRHCELSLLPSPLSLFPPSYVLPPSCVLPRLTVTILSFFLASPRCLVVLSHRLAFSLSHLAGQPPGVCLHTRMQPAIHHTIQQTRSNKPPVAAVRRTELCAEANCIEARTTRDIVQRRAGRHSENTPESGVVTMTTSC